MKTIHYYIIVCLAAIFSFVFTSDAEAQTRKVMNRPYIDQRLFHYGFLAGVHLQDIELQQNGYTDENGNQWYAEVPNYEPGFSVGSPSGFKFPSHETSPRLRTAARMIVTNILKIFISAKSYTSTFIKSCKFNLYPADFSLFYNIFSFL